MTFNGADTSKHVLIVEDEADLAELVRYNLNAAGYKAEIAADGRQALARLSERRPDLVVLDVMLPHHDGIEITRFARTDSVLKSIPIIVLTAKGAEDDQVAGLNAGADDYITKPFSMQVLLARIDALLRRAESHGEPAEEAVAETSLGPVQIDPGVHEATVDGRILKLTLTEFRLLACLVEAQGCVLSRNDLIVKAIGPGITVTERTIDVHVASIRKKLMPYQDIILTVRGVGYRMVDPR
ncbi:MAG: response regulator transcription factor [Planctomycetota bacterium]